MSREKYAKQDEQLYFHIRNMQAGRMDSYTEVYNLSAKYLYKIIYDIVQNYHTTEDMLQETFLKIYNNIGSLQSPEAYFVWAGRIATNLCVRHIHKYRKEVLTTATEDGEGNEEFIFDTVAEDNEMFIPESVLENKEHQRMIGEVIDSLSVEQKLAVQCFYFEEMSVKEIATLMECSEGTIKSRLNYARKSIKDSVLNIEKTQGTKLYSFGAIPVLLLIFKNTAQAAVPASAVASTGAALAGMYGNGGLVAGASTTVGGANLVGGTTTGVTGMTATTGTAVASGAAAASISGKLVAIIASAVIATGGIVGGTIWAVNEESKKVNIEENTTEIMTENKVVEDETVNVEQSTNEEETDNKNDQDINQNGDVIPPGGKYIVASTGKEINEGNKMPENPERDDCYYFGDYKYIYTNGDWKVELGEIEDFSTRERFGEILDSIAGYEVTNISGLFMECSGMVEAPKIPESVTNLVGTFSGCKSLVEAPVIPKGARYMADTFLNCESLIEAPEIPDSVEMMDGCFSHCISLVEAPKIPEGVTSLLETFSYCKSLEKAPELPESVIDLSSTFMECSSLVEAPVIPKNVGNMENMFAYCENLEKVPEIPYGVTNMDYTFYWCRKMKEAPELPETVINLKATFHSCESLLEAPNIPPEVVDLSYTFANCISLVKAPEIPMGVKRMEYTFGQCEKLTSAPVIPASVIDVTSTFIYCFGLTGTITIDANPVQYDEFLQGISLESQNIEVVGASTMLEELKATSGFHVED